MKLVRLYLDEDAMRRSLVFGLRARGVDVLTARDCEMINRNDEEHLALATESEVLAPQQRYPVGEELRRLMRLMTNVGADAMRDRIEFLSAWS